MPVDTFEYRTEAERLAMRQAIAFIAQMNDLALAAPPGHVLATCEQQALTAGRDLLRASLQQAVQSYVDAAEEKKGSSDSASAAGRGGGSGAAGARS